MTLDRFLCLEDLDDPTLAALLRDAERLEREPLSEELRGKVLGLVFANPSLRTMASMQTAMAQLGGSSFVIAPGRGSWELAFETGEVMDGAAAEHVREAIPVLESYADGLAVRLFAEGRDLETDLADRRIVGLADLARKPFVNLESAARHPCQALGDWKTLDDLEIPRRGGRFVLAWAPHPRPLPLAVPISTLLMAARRGMEVTVVAPPGFELPEAETQRARALAEAGGGSLRETTSVEQAMRGAQVLYAKSWQAPSAYGDPEREATLRRAAAERTVRVSWFREADPGARFLHCLPVRRNVVVEDAVLDGPHSAVLRQAANRLHAQKALLRRMLGERT